MDCALLFKANFINLICDCKDKKSARLSKKPCAYKVSSAGRCPNLCSCELFFLVYLSNAGVPILPLTLPLHLGVVANLRRCGDFLTTAHLFGGCPGCLPDTFIHYSKFISHLS